MIEAGCEFRKPRIAIMGEFSAGKSTLSNLLLGRHALPEKVTATRLPPVWLSAGDEAPYRVTTDGHSVPVDFDRLEQVPLDDTLYVKLAFDAEILDRCDLIDFPGISDPNMDPEVWQRMLGEVDAILWCTHATQAWRQSEAAAWEMVPEAVRQNSLLLITRFDKLINDHDKMRVLTRMARETAGLFAEICPISLTRAIAATDADQWQASGAEAFSAALDGIITGLTGLTDPEPEDLADAEAPSATAEVLLLVQPVSGQRNQPRALLLTEAVSTPPAPEEAEPRHIVPRRVRPTTAPSTQRRDGSQPNLQVVASDPAPKSPDGAGRIGRLRVLFS